MHSVLRFTERSLVLLLFFYVPILVAQEEGKQHEKKNPGSRNLEIGAPQQDTVQSIPNVSQRQLPKFDLPEYVITGNASIDLPKVEKISFEDVGIEQHRTIKSSISTQRDRETREFGTNRLDHPPTELNIYSGMVQAGIGTYFTPRVGLWFGQALPDFQYTMGGTYHLTKGFSENTDESRGSIFATGRTALTLDNLMIPTATLNGGLGYESQTFRFYGSMTPHLQRTISDLRFNVGIENQSTSTVPFVAGVSLEDLRVSDSSAVENETCIDLNLQTTLSIASFPLQMKFHGMTATGGLSFMDISSGIQNYSFAGVLLDGALHVYWAKGMAGQNLFRLRPQLSATYPMTQQHRIYISYEPLVVPMTMAANIGVNRFLSIASIVRHADVTNAGVLGVESDWNKTIRTRFSIGIKSVKDLTMFSDSSRQGVWSTAYGGQATIVTFCAEMVAKFESNDYFASNILLRSTKDSFFGLRIPYVPAIEAGCHASHGFGKAIVVSADVRFVGEQQADLVGKSTVSGYGVLDVSGDYIPFDFLRLTIGIRNLTDTWYETWLGYREAPFMLHMAVQVKW